jgi:integrase
VGLTTSLSSSNLNGRDVEEILQDIALDHYEYQKRAIEISEKAIADLIEFLFLTGCRAGEAFALKWNDIKLDKGWIVFDESYSSETKITKCTKTDTIRIFRIKDYTRLLNLINRLKIRTHAQNDYVFISPNGKQYNRFKLNKAWNGIDKSKDGNTYYYPGVVTRLVQERKISQYLKPSATRHTFITIQAHGGTDLKLLADSVGNSVDIIYNHYLGINKDALIADI